MQKRQARSLSCHDVTRSVLRACRADDATARPMSRLRRRACGHASLGSPGPPKRAGSPPLPPWARVRTEGHGAASVALRAPWRAVPAAARPQTRDPRAYRRPRSRLIPIPRARPLGSARGRETHAPPPPPSHHPPSPILGAAGTPASGGRLGGPRTSTRRPRSSPTVARPVPAPRALAVPPHPRFAAFRPRQAPPPPKTAVSPTPPTPQPHPPLADRGREHRSQAHKPGSYPSTRAARRATGRTGRTARVRRLDVAASPLAAWRRRPTDIIGPNGRTTRSMPHFFARAGLPHPPATAPARKTRRVQLFLLARTGRPPPG